MRVAPDDLLSRVGEGTEVARLASEGLAELAIAHIPYALSLTAADRTWLVTVNSYRGGQGSRLRWPCGCQSTTRRVGDTRMRTIGDGRSSLHARQQSFSHLSIVQPIVAASAIPGAYSAHSLDDLLISRAFSSLSPVFEAVGRGIRSYKQLVAVLCSRSNPFPSVAVIM